MAREVLSYQANILPAGRKDMEMNGSRDGEARGSSSAWRGIVVAVFAAILLSLTATLLLGGLSGPCARKTADGGKHGRGCGFPGEDRAIRGK
jgi:hypothetical protein